MKTIISVGCSWTFGHGVSANETYSAYLQDSLDNCQVINAGHCGCDNRYSVFSAVRLIEKFNPDILTDWLSQIPETKLNKIQVLVDGNSTKQYANDEELNSLAKREGWILNPDNKNIDEPLAKYD